MNNRRNDRRGSLVEVKFESLQSKKRCGIDTRFFPCSNGPKVTSRPCFFVCSEILIWIKLSIIEMGHRTCHVLEVMKYIKLIFFPGFSSWNLVMNPWASKWTCRSRLHLLTIPFTFLCRMSSLQVQAGRVNPLS